MKSISFSRYLQAVLLLASITLSIGYARGTRDAAAEKAMKDFANGENGILAWQSRRSAGARIFACNLDGANFHQVSAEESGKDHYAPMISPDGSRLVYYQTAKKSESDYYKDHTGNMILIGVNATKGKDAKTLVTKVRTYGEHRWARWLDNDRIAYIADNHDTYEYTISSGKSRKLFKGPSGYGAVPNRQLTYAVMGKGNIFYKVNNPGENGTLKQIKDYDGCQGNLSADGVWGYRTGGLQSGFHPIRKMKLSKLDDGIILAGKDNAFPSTQQYLYYPQISLDQRFIAVGVSRGKQYDEHSHHNADYDIYVVRLKPTDLSKSGSAVKYSFNSGCDSYPDIWAGKATSIKRGHQAQLKIASKAEPFSLFTIQGRRLPGDQINNVKRTTAYMIIVDEKNKQFIKKSD